MQSIEPHKIQTGDHHEDYVHKLILVLNGPSGRREYQTDVSEACAHDNAYDHAYSTCESPHANDSCWYEDVK